MTEKKVLKERNGVRLIEVGLNDSTGRVATNYVVTSRRTPEAPNFRDLSEAERYFDGEAERSSGASAR